MNVSLTPELEALVAKKVQSGMYHTASEVIREGLRLLKEQDEIKELRLQELRRDITLGVEQMEGGSYTTYDSPGALSAEIKAEGRERLVRRVSNRK